MGNPKISVSLALLSRVMAFKDVGLLSHGAVLQSLDI
jgi:hypothetical protein